MILVQPPNGDLLFGAPQLALDVAVFPASAGFQCQSTVSPQLSLGAKTIRRLDQRHRQRRTNGSERWNLPDHQAFFSKRVIQIKITAPTNATTMEPIMPPPGQIPKSPKTQPPKAPPRMPRMMSTSTP